MKPREKNTTEGGSKLFFHIENEMNIIYRFEVYFFSTFSID